MSSHPVNVDLFIPVYAVARSTERSSPTVARSTTQEARLSAGLPQEKLISVLAPGKSEQYSAAAPPLRHKRRFTIRSLSRTLTDPGSLGPQYHQRSTSSTEVTDQRSSVTISRSSSASRRTNPSSTRGAEHQTVSGGYSDSRIHISPSDGPAKIIEETRVLQDQILRSRSPRPQYPPTSWKQSSFQSDPSIAQASSRTPGSTVANGHDSKVLLVPNLQNFRILGASITQPPQSTSNGIGEDLWPQRDIPTSLGLDATLTPTPTRPISPVERQQGRTLDAGFSTPRRGRSISPTGGSSSLRSRRLNTLTDRGNELSQRVCRSLSRGNSESTTRWGLRRRLDLPAPELAYAGTDYFTGCPHTSPPLSRPLDVQPVLLTYRDGLLAYPPAHLQKCHPERATEKSSVSVIDGACCDCDLASRRYEESEVLERYNDKMDRLSQRLDAVKLSIGLESMNTNDPVTPPERILPSSSEWTEIQVHPADQLTLSSAVVKSILAIEATLNELIEQREREVKAIWRGYTNRWGPATIGIHRGASQTRSRSQSTRTATPNRSIDPPQSYFMPDGALSPSFSAITTTTVGSSPSFVTKSTNATTNATLPSTPGRRSIHSYSRSVAPSIASTSSPRDRYSDGTHAVIVNSSVDGIFEGGRMVVDWIRPERRGRRLKSPSRSPQR